MGLKGAVKIKLRFLAPLCAEDLRMPPSSISNSFLQATVLYTNNPFNPSQYPRYY